MPLVKAPAPSKTAATARKPRKVELARLVSPDPAVRRDAARNLSGDAQATAALATQLDSEPEPSVRDALFAGLVAIGGAPVAALIAPLLKREDAGLRGGALEALKLLDDDAVDALDSLLAEPDPDARILAIEVMRGWPAERAAPRLLRLIDGDRHVNVCGAAVDVATEVGTDELLAPLARLRGRFPGEGFLAFAIDIACTRIARRSA